MTIKELENKVNAETKTEAPKEAKLIITKRIKKTLLTEPTRPECILYLMKDEKVLGKRTFSTKQEQIEWYKDNVIKTALSDTYVDRLGRQVTYLEATVKQTKTTAPTKSFTPSQMSLI